MKKQLKLFLILFSLVFSSLNLANKTFLPSAAATYVEGVIAYDTTWALADSPFILSNNVIVNSNVTLKIEPDVEVKFGGNFSLTVNGRIIADGTENHEILFTPNDPTHSVAWRSIELNGPLSSSFTYCTIQYGTYGLDIASGSVGVRQSTFTANSENGIIINGGSVTIANTEVSGSGDTGIYVMGGNQVTIQDSAITSNAKGIFVTGGTNVDVRNNAVKLNEDGITLAGTLTGVIDVEQNDVTLNTKNGMVLNASSYAMTTVANNHISSNQNGFTVSSLLGTNLTRNYIWNNTIGINYESGNLHQAHFNDIYGNVWGMNVTGGATVSATHNYWGDKTGPRHISVNPYGRGNPVGGNGVDLDFVFFLSASIDFANSAPTAVLWTDKSLVARGQNVTFVGADSHDDGRVDKYLFDFGDGANSGWTTLRFVNHTYSSIGTYVASLTVLDDFNVTSINVATATVDVQDLIPLSALITLSQVYVDYTGQVSVTVYVSNQTTAMENAAVSLYSITGGYFLPQSGLTNSSGYFTVTYTSPNVVDVTDVRLIVKASFAGYADGSGYAYLRVLPPLQVSLTAVPQTVKSEATASIVAQVTLGTARPMADALVILNAQSGTTSPPTSVTDSNGTATFTFTAPRTLVEINVNVLATATKLGYSEGAGQTAVTVQPRILVVEVDANPPIVVSETMSTVMARVTSDGLPVLNATVSVSSDVGGNFSSTLQLTNFEGRASFVFTAPRVTDVGGSAGVISTSVTKDGYISGAGQVAITIVPKFLITQLTVEPNATTSEAQVNASIYVVYGFDMSPVPNASVSVTLANGQDITSKGTTDADGYTKLSFYAPPVDTQTAYTVSVVASKAGFVDGQNSTIITVYPGTINVQVVSSAPSVTSGDSTVIDVYVRNGENRSLANVSVTVSSTYGNFTNSTKLSDSNGLCQFVYDTPITDSQLTDDIVANATKTGYVTASNQTSLNVTPRPPAETGGGWSLLTILLIVIPVAVVVIVLVLIKLKVISVSMQEEEE